MGLASDFLCCKSNKNIYGSIILDTDINNANNDNDNHIINNDNTNANNIPEQNLETNKIRIKNGSLLGNAQIIEDFIIRCGEQQEQDDQFDDYFNML